MLNKQQRLRKKKENEKAKKTIEYLERSGKLAESRKLYLEQKARYEASTHDQIEYSKRAMALAKKKRDYYLSLAEKQFSKIESSGEYYNESSDRRTKGLKNSNLNGLSDVTKALILFNYML